MGGRGEGGLDTRASVRDHQRPCFIHGHRMIYSFNPNRPHCFTFRCPVSECTQIFQMRRDRFSDGDLPAP